MSYVAGVERTQQVLFPESLDDYVGAENPVRFLDAFVASLDLARLGVQRATPEALGRPPYDPGDLLRLYLYGYLHRLRSSRKLEQETHRNVELMWLLRRLTPDHKTIADFRRDNPAALKAVCREFTLLCKQLGLFGGELVAIDGSKFRAVNSKHRNVTPREIERRLRRTEVHIAEYLTALETADRAEAGTPASTEAVGLAEKIAELRERQATYTALQAEMHAAGETQRSLTDPDSRLMKAGMGVAVCYNAQIAVDEKHKLIVTQAVTNDPTDRDWLSPMATAANEVLETRDLQALTDRGYYNGPEIATCVKAGIMPVVPRPETSGNAKHGLFTKADFNYDAARDEYRCPAGERLTYRGAYVDRTGSRQRRYETRACGGCALRAQCTRGTGPRRIIRWEKEALLDAMSQRLKDHPDLRGQRQLLVEHPFGTMKRGMDQGYFLMRGLVKVGGEFSLTVLAYNLKRVIKIVGVPQLLAAMRGRLPWPASAAATA